MSRYEISKSKKYSSIFWIIFLIVLIAAMTLLYKKNDQNTESAIKSLVIPVEEKVAIKTETIVLPEQANEQKLKDLSIVQNEIKPLNLDLANSDEVFRTALTELSAKLVDWISVKDVIRKYIVIINDLSQKQILYKHRKFLKMPQKMQVKEDSTGLFIAEESYQRYDLLADTIADIDVPKALGVYMTFKPLFEQVYTKFSYPENYRVEDIFIKAAAAIIQAPVLERRIKVVRHSVGYKFADKRLEAMNDVEKQMLRMGSKNTKKIQEKLKQFVKGLLILSE